MSSHEKFNLVAEKYLLNELPTEQIESLRSNKSFINEVASLEEDNKEFFNRFNVSELSQKAIELSKPKIIKFPKKTIASITAVAACLIAVLNFSPILENEQGEVIFLKGANTISVYKKIDANVQKLKNLDEVRPNDQLQITYKAKDNYGVIFSVDGLNNITFHFPENINSAKNLEIGKEKTLPSSYILDSAPYFEKFYFITSDKSFDFSLIQNQILSIEIENGRIVKDLFLPKEYTIKSLTLIKD